jgi:hypothetical protein
MNTTHKLFIKMCLLTAKIYSLTNNFNGADYWVKVARVNIDSSNS